MSRSAVMQAIRENTDWICSRVVPAVHARQVRGMEYAFQIRKDVLAQVLVPTDMTKAEADRLCAFIKTLVAPEGK